MPSYGLVQQNGRRCISLKQPACKIQGQLDLNSQKKELVLVLNYSISTLNSFGYTTVTIKVVVKPSNPTLTIPSCILVTHQPTCS